MTTRLRARFDGKALIPTGPVDLPTGEVLDIEVCDSRRPEGGYGTPGSPAAVLGAIMSPPFLTQEDLKELEQAIAENQLPASDERIFEDQGE